jgi:hypothetical protein
MGTNETPDVYRAICQVAKEMSRDGIAKSRQNTQGAGYKFRGIDDIYNALSAVISGAGLCILPRMSDRVHEERASKAGGALFYVTVRADFDFVSVKDGSKHTVTMYGEAMDSSDKATNKAMSAAYKYACMQVFCIPTEGMDDADAHTPEPAPKPAPAAKPKHTPAQQEVVDRKLAEIQGRQKPDPMAQFSQLRALVGDDLYFRVIGSHGYEDASQIQDLEKARAIYKEIAAAHDGKKGAA